MILVDPDGRRLAGLPPGDWSAALVAMPPSGGATNGSDHAGGEGDAATRTVRDLGFIEITGLRDGVQVRLRPMLVTGPAITQLFFSLADMRPARVVLVRFDEERQVWRHEICGHWRNALERVNELVFANDRLPSYVATELDPAELEAQPEDGLVELHLLWDRSNRRLENGAAEAFGALELVDRSVLVAVDRRNEALRILRFGAGLNFYDREWTGSAIGRDVTDQPDGVFATRIGANLRRAMALDRLLFHRVEATVRRSVRTSVQVSYRRLVLPWHMADGRRAATSTVLLDQFIEIAR